MQIQRLVVLAVLASVCGLSACASQPGRLASPSASPAVTPTAPSTQSDAPTPAPTQTSASARASTSPPAGPVTVNLTRAEPLLAQLPSVETVSIYNPGLALKGLAIRVAIGKQQLGVGSNGLQNTILERWRAATARWAPVAIYADPQVVGLYEGSYQSDIPSGTSSLRLRITIGPGFRPALDGREVPLTLTLAGGATVVGEQQLMLPVLAPTVAVVSAPTTMSRDGQAEFDFVVLNSTGATYPTFATELNIVCDTATIACNAPGGWMLAGFGVDWFDGAAWKALTVGGTPNGETSVESSPLPPGSQRVRIRLTFGPGLDPRARSASLQLFVGRPSDGYVNDVAWTTAAVSIVP
jgi:hypothetical protein